MSRFITSFTFVLLFVFLAAHTVTNFSLGVVLDAVGTQSAMNAPDMLIVV